MDFLKVEELKISTLSEHFLVPEHRMLLWLLFGSDSANLKLSQIHKNLMFTHKTKLKLDKDVGSGD